MSRPPPSRPARTVAGSPAAQGGLVYSTEAGRMCPHCRQPLAACACRALAGQARLAQAQDRSDGVLRVGRSRSGRAGKTVTTVQGLVLPEADLAAMGKALRQACGAGGTVVDGVLEVQGDHVERVIAWLQARGHAVKRTGG